MKEEADVIRLEGGSFAAFYYNMIGRIDEKLDRERSEAFAARVKCDAAVRQLQNVERHLAACNAELNTLALCEEHYRFCLEEKAAAIKASAQPDGLEILRLETLIQIQECRLKELNEATDAGKSAHFTAEAILSCLEHTAGMGSWDLLGGGIMPESSGRDYWDHCQSLVEQLQGQLLHLRTEVTYIPVDAGLGDSLSGLTHFADLFFDGLFADWAALDRITHLQSQVRMTHDQICKITERLAELLHSAEEELDLNRRALHTRIINA